MSFMSDLKNKWNQRYRSASLPARPALVLLENIHLLPKQGTALDLACGLGGNAVHLANHGLQTSAWDISEVSIGKVQAYAQQKSLSIDAQVRDVVEDPPQVQSFDVLVVSRFLERAICSALMDAIKPGGLLLYQTFTNYSGLVSGPGNPEYLLGTHELLTLFSPLQVIAYRDEADLGDIQMGLRGEAYLVAKKPI